MTTLTWQTLLLLAVTYFAGCCIGCLAHRAVWRRRAQPAVVETAEPLSVSGAAAQAGPDRSTAPAPVVANRTATASSAQPAREPFRRADAPTPQPKPVTGALGSAAGGADQAARMEHVLEFGGQIPARPEPVASTAGDDLKRIRAIDAALEAQLKALGADTFATIAQWTAADTARMSRELGFKGRIEQENWIEQAQILAKGGDTRYSQRLARGEVAAARAIEDEGERRPPVAALASAVSVRRPQSGCGPRLPTASPAAPTYRTAQHSHATNLKRPRLQNPLLRRGPRPSVHRTTCSAFAASIWRSRPFSIGRG